MKEYHYIDDYRFAEMYFAYGFEKGRGVSRIRRELAEKGVTEEEFERVKNLKKSVLEYSTETNADIAEANGSMMHLFERCKTLEERKAQIENVSLEDVNEFAKVIANEEMFNVVAVGKKLNKEDLKQF